MLIPVTYSTVSYCADLARRFLTFSSIGKFLHNLSFTQSENKNANYYDIQIVVANLTECITRLFMHDCGKGFICGV